MFTYFPPELHENKKKCNITKDMENENLKKKRKEGNLKKKREEEEVVVAKNVEYEFICTYIYIHKKLFLCKCVISFSRNFFFFKHYFSFPPVTKNKRNLFLCAFKLGHLQAGGCCFVIRRLYESLNEFYLIYFSQVGKKKKLFLTKK